MNVEDVDQWLKRIEEISNDDEKAHELTDDLHKAVLRAIADRSCEDGQALAHTALKSETIEFRRWYA